MKKRLIGIFILLLFLILITTGPTFGATNLALNKPVIFSLQQTGNEAHYINDGDAVNTRWSASPYPQWVRIDLGAVYSINSTELVPLSNRAYQYLVEASIDGSSYTQVVNRTGNTTGGAVFTDNFSLINARYIRLTVTDCYNYTGTWISILEFRVLEAPLVPTPSPTVTPTVTPTPNSPSPTISPVSGNLALNKTVSCSSQQTGNEAVDMVDGDAVVSRWSASPYPQWARIDLGAVYSISRTELVPYSSRAYQYRIEVSTDGINYTQIVDRTSNTISGALLTDNFTSATARYVRLTVTGCYNYTGTWISIMEFRVYGQEITLSPTPLATPTATPTSTNTPTIIPTPIQTAIPGTRIDADGPGGVATYTLLRNGLGSDACAELNDNHHIFQHVQEMTDPTIGNCFVVYMHRDLDGDAADYSRTDRQRNEIRVGGYAPDKLKGFQGDTMEFHWKVYFSPTLKVTEFFNHFFQIKSNSGDSKAPLITLSGYKLGSVEETRILYSPGSGQTVIASYPAFLRGVWLQCYCKFTCSQSGSFLMTIKRIDTGETIISVNKTNIDMWREGDYLRGKWGIYRSLDDKAGLNPDEDTIRIANMIINKL